MLSVQRNIGLSSLGRRAEEVASTQTEKMPLRGANYPICETRVPGNSFAR